MRDSHLVPPLGEQRQFQPEQPEQYYNKYSGPAVLYGRDWLVSSVPLGTIPRYSPTLPAPLLGSPPGLCPCLGSRIPWPKSTLALQGPIAGMPTAICRRYPGHLEAGGQQYPPFLQPLGGRWPGQGGREAGQHHQGCPQAPLQAGCSTGQCQLGRGEEAVRPGSSSHQGCNSPQLQVGAWSAAGAPRRMQCQPRFPPGPGQASCVHPCPLPGLPWAPALPPEGQTATGLCRAMCLQRGLALLFSIPCRTRTSDWGPKKQQRRSC